MKSDNLKACSCGKTPELKESYGHTQCKYVCTCGMNIRGRWCYTDKRARQRWAGCLYRTTKTKAQEITELTARIKQLETENKQLRGELGRG